jgi:hypothetical protein
MFHSPKHVSTRILQMHTHSTTWTKINIGLNQAIQRSDNFLCTTKPTNHNQCAWNNRLNNFPGIPAHTILANQLTGGYSYVKVRGRSAKPQTLACESPNQTTVENIQNFSLPETHKNTMGHPLTQDIFSYVKIHYYTHARTHARTHTHTHTNVNICPLKRF